MRLRTARIFEDSLVTGAGRTLSLLLGVAATVVVTRLLGPANKGSYSIVLLVITTTSAVASGGLASANVYAGAKSRDLLPALAANSVLSSFVLGGAGAIVIQLLTQLPTVRTFLEASAVELRWVQLSILVLPFLFLGAGFRELFRAAGHIALYSGFAVLRASLELGLILAVVYAMRYGVPGAVGSWVAAELITLGVMAVLLVRVVGWHLRPNLAVLRDCARFGGKLHIGLVAQFLNYRLDAFLLVQ